MTGTPSTASSMGAGFSCTVDELGQFVAVEIDATMFDMAAVFKTAYWGTERAFLYLSQDKVAGRIYAELRPKKSDATNLDTIAREFFNALIDQQTRQIVLRETSTERDVLLTKAFVAGRGHLDPKSIC